MDFQTALNLCRVIRENWNRNGSESVDSLHPPTPEELAIEICSGYDESTTFELYDAGCVLAITLIGMGHDPSKINVIESPSFEYHYSIAKHYASELGFNIVEYNPEELDFSIMDFDVTLGNPPYQSGEHNSTTNSMWKEFLSFSHKRSKELYLVLPDIALAPPTFSKYKNEIVSVNTDIEKYFPGVGSGFCTLRMSKNPGDTLTIKTKGETYSVPIGSLDCIPNDFNQSILDEMKKYLIGTREWNLTYEYESRKNIFCDDGQYSVLHTSKNGIRRTNVHHPNNDLIRVSVDVSGHPRFHFIHNMGLTQSHYWTTFETEEEARSYVEWGNSDEVQSFLRKVKWGGMNSALIIKNLM